MIFNTFCISELNFLNTAIIITTSKCKGVSYAEVLKNLWGRIKNIIDNQELKKCL